MALALGLFLSVLLWIGGRRALHRAVQEREALKEEAKNERLRLEERLEQAQLQRGSAEQQVARLEAEKHYLDEKIQSHGQDMERLEAQFRERFENLANRIFDEKSQRFRKESEEGLGQILNPLRERLGEFQKKVDESFGQQAKEQFSLKDEIKRIVLANEKITVQAENLALALKGDSKTQGNWGEMVLEKILEDSGLRKGTDYRVQMELKSAGGERLRPDVVVMLPEAKHLIIDSKVSLTHYERYCSEPDEERRAALFKQFLQSVRAHVSGLEQRKYQDTEELGTPDFVLMFVPVEGAYMLAVQHDPGLHGHAWDKRVVIVCPTTLFSTLRTVASVWRIELQNKNALEIARQGGKLYDKVASFVEEMLKLGKQIGGTQKTFEDAFKQLSEGQGNILRRTEQLRALGIKAAKRLPEELLDEESPDEAIRSQEIEAA
jgi:DNA recombination protein RmuC